MKYAFLLTYIVCCFTNKAAAQLCSGSLGDPILNMTFGAQGFQMPRNMTTFEPTGDCPNKGQYIVSSFLFGCGSNNDHSWIKMIGDHTRDLNGNYMLVNAESTPAPFTQILQKSLRQQQLCFSAWISNAMQRFYLRW